MRYRPLILALLSATLILLASCSPAAEPGNGEAPTIEVATATPGPAPETPLPAGPELSTDRHALESMNILILESMPVQVQVEISGTVPDGCTTVEELSAAREGADFTITILTRRDRDALCTEALVPFSETVALDVFGLAAGTCTVSAAGRDGTLSETFTLAVDNVPVGEPPAGVALPPACAPGDDPAAGLGPFVNLHDGYCFLYPAGEGFQVHDVLPIGVAAVWGPPLTPTFEPIRAGLTVYRQEPAGDRTLDEVVASILAAHPGAQVVDASATFAGEAAQAVEGIEGMMDSRRHYLIHDGFVFEITLVPLTQPAEFEAAVSNQREALWGAVSASFSWLPEEFIAQFAGCPAVGEPGPNPVSPYVNVEDGYCLLYPAHFGQAESATLGMVAFNGPANDPTAVEPLRGRLMVEIMGPADGRTVGQVVDELVAGYPDLEIQVAEDTLGGEPALVVTGLPGRFENRDLFTVHDDLVYHLHLEPLGFPEVASDLESAWGLITASFVFLP